MPPRLLPVAGLKPTSRSHGGARTAEVSCAV